jgi:hypothetical protein
MSWVPIMGLIVALFVAPSSTGAAARASLDVSPDNGVYGGQLLTFSGAVGPGDEAIWLQRRGEAGAAWADVPDSIPKPWTTGPDGKFRFTFHAPAMNAVQFRVVSRTSETPVHTFSAEHQDADVLVREKNPASVQWPGQTVLEPLPRGFAVDGEPYEIRIDTVNRANDDKKPVLLGRGVRLELRQPDNSWAVRDTGALDDKGFADFTSNWASVDGVYRAVLEDWTKYSDNVGWFPSLPFYFRIVDRPLTVTGLDAAWTSPEVVLTWTLPSQDPNRHSIVVVRGAGGGDEPTWAAPRFTAWTIPGTRAVFRDTTVLENRSYRYAVYTLSADGVYSRVAARDTVMTEPPPAPKQGARR